MQNRVVFRQTDNIRLVHLQKQDAEVLVEFVNDPEITQFLGLSKPTTLSEEREWLEAQLENMKEEPVFGIELTESNELIGTMGLTKVDTTNRVAETGAMIGRKDCWGEGHGTSAKMLLLKYAFNSLGLRIVYSRVYASNPRSLAYSQKCGYEQIATLPGKHLVGGEFVDELILQITPQLWQAQYDKWQNGNL